MIVTITLEKIVRMLIYLFFIVYTKRPLKNNFPKRKEEEMAQQRLEQEGTRQNHH